jgi:hypothetical protein
MAFDFRVVMQLQTQHHYHGHHTHHAWRGLVSVLQIKFG